MKTLRLILGDQLNINHSWFKTPQHHVIYCLFEMRQETDYTEHHILKVVGFFAAMRQFAKDLKTKKHRVAYFEIDAPNNTQNLEENLSTLISDHQIERFEYMEPDEHRLDVQLHEFCKSIEIPSKMCSSEHFYTSRFELQSFFKGKNQFLMETFYRYMRKKHDILMVGKHPEGGKWNYDKSNRKPWKEHIDIPPFKQFDNDVSTVLTAIEKDNIKTVGFIENSTLDYPISLHQAEAQLQYFCEHLLIHFGDFQDAMHTHEVYLFHSRLSFALNIKLISPKHVVNRVLDYYRAHEEEIHISQVEGFIRQLLGWREYMRGMYWMLGIDYKKKNALKSTNHLANFFWTGNTKMNCLKNAITNSLQNAYAHHIQRLMITGNYALLTMTHPDEVDAWYLGMYMDAIEWVQLPNTRGMSQYADGGLIATKPYISSANYIHKMSNYCQDCYYDKKSVTGPEACPFNSLYWNFLDEKRDQLENNLRMKMMYSLLDKKDASELNAIKEKAQHIIANQEDY
ncbi:cryptochrome/photolyase family protein [Aestuariivivens sediminicola]|uniref:cryptochrome/photolyase family protein n=1 Tax=Aestuariivivens sediminicola TaxID=2913560 RepID=UPI001F56EC9A|nr:cryptochrome/photolyase family protein [Aestuariivivens sediminicola]